MNQLQLSQAQSPRESNFDYEDQPNIQSLQLQQKRQALSIITNIQIIVAVFQILLILFNSYIAFDLSYKISLLYITILHFLQIIRIGVYNNKQKNQKQNVQKFKEQIILLHSNILGHLFYLILCIQNYKKGCLIYFLENKDFPIQYPILMHLVFTFSWFIVTLKDYLKNKCEKTFISVFTVLIRVLFVSQLVLINFKQIQWIDWEWIYVFTLLWVILSLVSIFQMIFLFDFICKATSLLQENDPLNRENLNQQIIGSLWINLIILCMSGVPTFTMICFTIKLSTNIDSFNSMGITLSVLYSLVFIVYTLYYRITLSQFVQSIKITKDVMTGTQAVTENLQRYQINSPSSKHKNQLIKNKEQILTRLPQFLVLIRLSQTYFLPFVDNERPQQMKQSQSISSPKLSKRNKTDLDQPKQSNRNSLTEMNIEKDQQCFNCCQNECQAVYLPCGHGGLCIKCATEWFQEKQECLICRKPVESVVKVSLGDSNKFKIIDVLAF